MKKALKKIIEHFKRTWKNKLLAVALAVGTFLGSVWCKDGTAFIFGLFLAFGLWVIDENVF